MRHGDRELFGGSALNLEEVSGLVGSVAEEVGVVGEFDPLIGSKAKVGIGAEGVDLNVGAEDAGDSRYDGAVFAGPLEGGLGFVAALMDFDAVELIFETTIASGRRGLAGAVTGAIAGLCGEHSACRLRSPGVHGGAAILGCCCR